MKRTTMILQQAVSLEQELVRVRQQEHARILAECFQAVEQARRGFRLNMLTPEPCDRLAQSLGALREAIQAAITDLDTPEVLAVCRPYTVLMKLRPLHRLLVETQVLVAGCRSLCLAGRLIEDRTGMYWQCQQAILDIRRRREELFRLLTPEASLAVTA